jgi:hypothetical protein
MKYRQMFYLEIDPSELTELTDFNPLATRERTHDLLRRYPGIDLVDLQITDSGVDITVASQDPADDIVAHVLHRALRLPHGRDSNLRRIPPPSMGWGTLGRRGSSQESHDPGSRHVLGAPPGEDAPPRTRSSTERGGSSPPGTRAFRGGGGGLRQRYLVGQCPDTVQAGQRLSLLVRIAVSEGGARLKSFPVPEDGLDVLLIVRATGLRLLSGERQTVRVLPDGDSEPRLFELAADAPGPGRISATAWQGGNFLGELVIEVSAVPHARVQQPRDSRADLSPDISDGAVTLEVIYDASRNAYRFQFHDADDNPREETHALSNPPGPLVEELVNELAGLAEQGRVANAGQTRDYLQDAGARLWRTLLPGPIREQFWERRHRISQLKILADGDAVPWEVLYPMDPGRDEGFLVEQDFPVTRDVFGRPPLARSLNLRPAYFVRPTDSLVAAGPEVNVLRRLIGPRGQTDNVLSGFSPLRTLVNSGDFGLLHFACHNTFSAAGGSSISLDDRPFTTTSLETARINRTLRASAPLVFINACRSAGAAATYNGLDSWAEAFMAAGAGVFVGSLWAVSDGVAREFSEEFYHQLKGGLNLGQAVTAARRCAARQAGDPTWLAYTVYGDPRATLAAS